MTDPAPHHGDHRFETASVLHRVPSDYPVTPSEILYQSKGCLLVISPGQHAARLRPLVESRLDVFVLLTDEDTPGALPEAFTRIRGTLVTLTGHLGQFKATIEGEEEPLNLALLCPGERGFFDLVLDLSTPPCLPVEVHPVGYFAPGDDPEALGRALDELPTLVGTFVKPKFFEYYASKCVHTRRGIEGCRRCIEACPAQAIGPQSNGVQVNPFLCQGCGACALVCPTEAIVHLPSSENTLLPPLHTLLKRHTTAGDAAAPCLLFHDSEDAQALIDEALSRLSPRMVPLPVHTLAAFGTDTWLSVLAYGAAEALLLMTQSPPITMHQALQQQLDHARAILTGMGYSAQRIDLLRVTTADELHEALRERGTIARLNSGEFTPFINKRKNTYKAVAHLLSQVPPPPPFIELAPGAPFGEVCVDTTLCTLCLACVEICPTTALNSGDDDTLPQLNFVEGLCVQCGLCAAACPEEAIHLNPRFLYDSAHRSQRRLLHQEPPFHCITCGQPFTTQAIVNRLTERLKDNPHFSGERITQLQQCPDCRSRYNLLEQFERVHPP
jgi:ferredoxin